VKAATLEPPLDPSPRFLRCSFARPRAIVGTNTDYRRIGLVNDAPAAHHGQHLTKGAEAMDSLNDATRWSISLGALACAAMVFATVKDPGFRRRLGGWLLLVVPPAMVVTHVLGRLPNALLLPLGLGLGSVLATSTLRSEAVRRAFDGLSDGGWRALMLFRSVFGSLLLAAGGLQMLPASFCLQAGTGDIAAGLLAAAIPHTRTSSALLRLAAFGFGLLDFVNVVRLVVTVVRPFLEETGGPGISLMLPWVGVPLLVMVNVHGLRVALADLRGTRAEVSSDAVAALR
jgi:hypothetical protein